MPGEPAPYWIRERARGECGVGGYVAPGFTVMHGATPAARMKHDSVRPSPAFGTLSPLRRERGVASLCLCLKENDALVSFSPHAGRRCPEGG